MKNTSSKIRFKVEVPPGKDDADLRSADALDLRELSVSASWMAAVLVSEPASGPANGYLTVRRSVRRIDLLILGQQGNAIWHPLLGLHQRV
jgi:hypothetical protein